MMSEQAQELAANRVLVVGGAGFVEIGLQGILGVQVTVAHQKYGNGTDECVCHRTLHVGRPAFAGVGVEFRGELRA